MAALPRKSVPSVPSALKFKARVPTSMELVGRGNGPKGSLLDFEVFVDPDADKSKGVDGRIECTDPEKGEVVEEHCRVLSSKETSETSTGRLIFSVSEHWPVGLASKPLGMTMQIVSPGPDLTLRFLDKDDPKEFDRVHLLFKQIGFQRVEEAPDDVMHAPMAEQDIGVFEAPEESLSDVGAQVLMGQGKGTLDQARHVVDNLLMTARGTQVSSPGWFSVLEGDTPLLGTEACGALKRMVDAAARRDDGGFDTKLDLSLYQLERAVGLKQSEALLRAFAGRVDEIKLRRVEALPGASTECINFHLDTSLRTMQVSLCDDSEYEGNRIVYASKTEGFVAPPRSAGSTLLHDNTAPHGVTPITSGVRYGLFLLTRP